jgi:large subunit ribosomal protein L10
MVFKGGGEMMANKKIIEKKQSVVDEIKNKINSSASFVVFENHGLTVAETNELRRSLRESESDFKIYKNTLMARTLNDLQIDLGIMEGPKAVAFGTDAIAPVKTLSEFAKKHKALELKIGYVDKNVADLKSLNELAAIPSRIGLLTMLAGGLIGTVKDLSICLDLYSKNLEK